MSARTFLPPDAGHLASGARAPVQARGGALHCLQYPKYLLQANHGGDVLTQERGHIQGPGRYLSQHRSPDPRKSATIPQAEALPGSPSSPPLHACRDSG